MDRYSASHFDQRKSHHLDSGRVQKKPPPILGTENGHVWDTHNGFLSMLVTAFSYHACFKFAIFIESAGNLSRRLCIPQQPILSLHPRLFAPFSPVPGTFARARWPILFSHPNTGGNMHHPSSWGRPLNWKRYRNQSIVLPLSHFIS
jgi:hypothetical protein